MADERINLMMSMGLLEICGTSFSILKKNLLLYIKFAVVFIVPSVIITVFALFKALSFYSILQVNPNDPKASVAFLSFVTMVIFVLLINAFFKSSVIESTKRIILVESLSFERIVFNSMKSFPLLLVTYLIGSLMIFTGLCFFIIPGLLLMAFLIYVPQIYIIEKKSLYTNMRKSFIYSWKSFITAILVPVFVYMTYAGILVILLSFFTSDFIMNFFLGGGIRPDVKLEYSMMTTGYKAFLISTLVVFYLFFYFFYLFAQIAVTLKYLNVKTVEEGEIAGEETPTGLESSI